MEASEEKTVFKQRREEINLLILAIDRLKITGT